MKKQQPPTRVSFQVYLTESEVQILRDIADKTGRTTGAVGTALIRRGLREFAKELAAHASS